MGRLYDFSFDFYQELLRTAKSNFDLYLVSEVPAIFRKTKRPNLILRHDVDVSLKKALVMARVEKRLGVRATYMVIADSSLYDLERKETRKILLKLIDLGHEVGLHFDIGENVRTGNSGIDSVEKKINKMSEYLKKIIGQSVKSISFHRPIPFFINGPFKINGMVNAYAKELMDWYLSDSKGYWREGNPLPLLKKPKSHLLQLLIHPIWWGEEHMLPEVRLRKFVRRETKGQHQKKINEFEEKLKKTVPGVKY